MFTAVLRGGARVVARGTTPPMFINRIPKLAQAEQQARFIANIARTSIPDILCEEAKKEAIRIARTGFSNLPHEPSKARLQELIKTLKDPSCKDFAKALEGFQAEEIDAMHIENSPDPLSEKEVSDLGIAASNISPDQPLYIEDAKMMVAQNAPNIVLLTDLLALQGLRPFDTKIRKRGVYREPDPMPPFFIITNQDTQSLHTDGPSTVSARQVDVTCLYAIKSDAKTATVIISAQDVFELLDDKTKEILRQPFFTDSRAAILTETASGKPKFFLKAGLMFGENPPIYFTGKYAKQDVVDALSNLKLATTSVLAKESVATIVDSKGQLLMNNNNILHKRSGTDPNSSISKGNGERLVLATLYTKSRDE